MALTNTGGDNLRAVLNQQLGPWGTSALDEVLRNIRDPKGVTLDAIRLGKQEAGYYGTSGGGQSTAGIPTLEKASEKFDDLYSAAFDEFDSFKAAMGGVDQAAIDATLQQIDMKQQTLQQAFDLAAYDPNAGIRAGMDVKLEAGRQRQATEREQMMYGNDPTSGRFQRMRGRTDMDIAKNYALAKNVGEREEKIRAGAQMTDLSKAIDPSQMHGITIKNREVLNNFLNTGIAAAQGQVQAGSAMNTLLAQKAQQATSYANLYAGMAKSGMSAMTGLAGVASQHHLGTQAGLRAEAGLRLREEDQAFRQGITLFDQLG